MFKMHILENMNTGEPNKTENENRRQVQIFKNMVY